MKGSPIIKVENLSKIFKLPHEKYSTARQHFVNVFSRKGYEKFKALDEVTFEVKKGEFFGIIGSNGSGKSTLLKILAQIYQPTSGKVEINGSLSPFIELGVGFNPELTARENVFLNAAILGLSKNQTEEKFDEIIEFAELREFLDQKFKNFSSGMQVRLAFSIAIQANADILVIDEVLAVGDSEFQQKCFETFRRLNKEGKTIIFVSHGLDVMLEFCKRVALINKGKLISIGDPRSVVNDYLSLVTQHRETNLREQNKTESGSEDRWGDKKVQILDAFVEDEKNKKTLVVDGKSFNIVVKYKFFKTISEPIFGAILRDAAGRDIFVTNTKIHNIKTETYKEGTLVTVKFLITNNLEGGDYSISPAVVDKYANHYHDWRNNYKKIIVRQKLKTGGVVNLPVEFKITKEMKK